ncbi:MAG: alpha-N-acetylglucosaminidase TIM-barrel domain-containing protein [Candidatus Hydrogenedentota bacterium]
MMRHLVAAAAVILAIAGAWAADRPESPPSTVSSPSTLTVIAPPTGERAYEIAAENFVDLWTQTTGRSPALLFPENAPLSGDIALIGSDAVNPMVHDLITQGALDTLDLRYGTDGYRILSVDLPSVRYLIVAGGCGRSTIYAVYDFFRRQAGAEYFWDGDVIPKRPELEIGGVDIAERPHFRYRGLRYFAHRGLHRFQAEHWDLEDWKREIDWLLKKRFNLFMLRTGHDDLFQRAFPGDVPYPPTDAQDPDAQDRSYNDRTSFWPLKYRGELRKEVLAYARDRGLLHPEDTGTITHWYSHTPSSFYKSFPDFPVVTDQKAGYSLATAAIWDVEDERAWDAYWRLTETHIREFGGGQPRMFHTIGMAERSFGDSRRDSLQKKLYAYRKTLQKVREDYPDAPMLIASWDFGNKWTDEEVHVALKEFDRKRTILLDYTADDAAKEGYRDWNVLGQFPWIFGMLHGFAWNSDIHGDYGILTGRLETAAADPMCKGYVLWSEISHNDTFMLEYLADNSWRPDDLTVATAVMRFCRSRYPDELAARMEPLWNAMLVVSQSENWSMRDPSWSVTFSAPQFHMLTSRMWRNLSDNRQDVVTTGYERMIAGLEPAPDMLAGLAALIETHYDNPQWRRDALDMARTTANRALSATVLRAGRHIHAWRQQEAPAEAIRHTAELNRHLLDTLCDLLGQSDDFSMAVSLERLGKAEPISGVPPDVNPHAELTLKGNAENEYCRSHHYELARHVYTREMEAFWDHVFARLESEDRSEWPFPPELGEQAKRIEDEFYVTPLVEMAPQSARGPAELAEALRRLQKLVGDLVKRPDGS